MKDRKQQKARFKELERQGWTITRTKGGHYKLVHPLGGTVIAPFSPSASGSWRQVERHIAQVEQSHEAP